jgi:ATP-dependent DNA helicase DinG
MAPSVEVPVLDALARAVGGLGGDARPGQQALAEAVSAAIVDGHHLLAEAGTGSGKSLAYLVPALLSGRKVVVATATKALQDQLWRKDIPHLREHLGMKFDAALLKGRSNYLCLALVDAAQNEGALFATRPSVSFADDLDFLAEWATQCDTGDEAELVVPVNPGSWRALTCGPGECPGTQRCHKGSDCFAEKARARAETADLLVVNTSLYCAHLASGGYVLPEHDIVIFDEAHELPDTATRAFGIDFGPGRLRFVASRLRKLIDTAKADAIARAADDLGKALDGSDARVDPTAKPLAAALVRVGESLATAATTLRQVGDPKDPDATALRQAAQLVAGALDDARRLTTPDAGDVVWVEGQQPSLRSAPIDVGDRLASTLFDRTPTICVSATLGTGDRFEPFARAIGLDPGATPAKPTDEDPGLGYLAERYLSPFDYKAQGRLYVAAHLPDPRQADWQAKAIAELRPLVEAAGGRTLVLSTSHSGAKAFAEGLRGLPGISVLAQGDMPKPQLIDAFIADHHSVLVATRSFWQGVDVPGDTCVLVAIDKLPFARPDDPLETARRERIEAAGGNAFFDVDIPRAALTLAQGAGRLLRTTTDRGVVAVLDPRLATARYRSKLLAALPPFGRTIDAAAVCAFLAETVASTSPVPADS